MSQPEKGNIFQTSGGITPEQGAFSEYNFGQNLLEGQGQFGGGDEGGGNALSTMATQVAGGAGIGEALSNIGQSQTDANAELQAFNIAQGQNQQEQNQLTQGASQAGTAGGSAAAAATPLPGSST
jgi:hypothetical protein